jgi:ribose transport system permease protein
MRRARVSEEEGAARPDRRAALAVLGKFQSFIGLAAIFLVASVICVRNGTNMFLSPDNLSNLIRSISENGIMAIGMTLVILLGGIDLSVGAILGLSATASADLLTHRGVPMWPAIALVLLMTAAFGFFNGVIHTKLNVQAFIITLASMNIARGLARFWSGGQGIPIAYGAGRGTADPAFGVLADRIFKTDSFFGVPVPAICFLLIAALFSVLLNYTRFGRYVYAIGGNETAAFLSGIKVDRIKIALFALCGVLAGFAGIVHAAQLRQGSPNDGTGYELSAIAAVAIGGTSMAGGKGTMAGTVVGALILGVLDNMLGLKNVNNNLQLIIKGLIIVAAVIMQRERKK